MGVGETHGVFPAHAGMSRTLSTAASNLLSFPRSRGDEPKETEKRRLRAMFSPLTRG